MIIDCDTCTVRGFGCDDCVVTALLGHPGAAEEPLDLARDEVVALDVLASSGLVAPLRHEPRADTG